MLPILRILPVGGVFLAIMILVLALSPPVGPRSVLSSAYIAARGALMQQEEHPEWRTFLILAATKRADELNRLRDLPDTPVQSAPDAGKFAGLPAARGDGDPDDTTGSIADIPVMNMPVEIGETSSTELPVATPEERQPAIRTPERVKTPRDSRTKATRRLRHVRAPKPEPEAPFNLLEAIFGKPPAAGSTQATKPAAARTEQR
jgi:hypothetical protein